MIFAFAITLVALLAIGWMLVNGFLDALEVERRKARDERGELLRLLERERELAEHRERSHQQEMAQLNQARMEETANLLQRIQAPQQAVVQHQAQAAPPDPPPVNLESDEDLFEVYRERLESLSG